jgi:regulator of cell morphogenesis and NO signaling
MMDPQTSLAELATTIPAASRVFQRHRLDFCCGGRTSLADACAERGLDAADVARQIEEAGRGADDVRWDERPAAEIIDHILERYHAPLREELPRLRDMAARVEERHADKAACPKGLAGRLETMIREVESHLGKEEQILFPMIKAGRGAMAQGPIRVMEEEHDEHGANLDRVRQLTNDFQPPEEACPTWKALYLGLEQLELDLMRHIHLENAVLFPKVLVGTQTR